MDSVVRGLVTYAFLLVLFRLAGKRTLKEVTTFDFVLLLIISEATQNGMVGKDYSLTNSFLLVLTLIGADILLSFVKGHFRPMERWLEDVPLVIVEDGRVLKDRTAKLRVDEGDILEAARELRGLERIDQIKYAVLERNGGISIIPKRQS
jgi:uncharacterized membrane protein YcaP (DUF421 family)